MPRSFYFTKGKVEPMQIEVTWQTITAAGAVVGALGGLGAIAFKFVRWVDRQKKQDEELAALRKHHDEDIQGIKEELAIQTYGILASLKGHQEQGCNGPVTEAVTKLEKHINKKAHE